MSSLKKLIIRYQLPKALAKVIYFVKAMRMSNDVKGLRVKSLNDKREKTEAWMKLVEKDLISVNININLELNRSIPEVVLRKLVDLTEDRTKWKKIVRDIMAVNR